MPNPVQIASTILLLIFGGMPLVGCQEKKSDDLVISPRTIVSPRALAVSKPVPVNQVEDGAIWIHPTDPSKSMLFISNKTRGLEVHRTDGVLIKHYDDGTEFAGIDVLYEFPHDGKTVDLLVAACQTTKSEGITIWRIDADKGKPSPATADSMIPVFDHGIPLGVCTYHSRKTGTCYFFVTSASGQIEQYELLAAPNDQFSAKRVRQFALPGKVKAGVADEERGVIYFAEEKVGIWRYPAEPDTAPEPTLVIRVDENGLIPDLTGIALYCGAGGQGYLIVVSQGSKGNDSQFQVYQRETPHAFVLSIQPSSVGYNAPQRSSGIVVTNSPTLSQFPAGLLAVKDRASLNGVEDYKIYSWHDIAQPGGLLIDTIWSPRPSKAARPH